MGKKYCLVFSGMPAHIVNRFDSTMVFLYVKTVVFSVSSVELLSTSKSKYWPIQE